LTEPVVRPFSVGICSDEVWSVLPVSLSCLFRKFVFGDFCPPFPTVSITLALTEERGGASICFPRAPPQAPLPPRLIQINYRAPRELKTFSPALIRFGVAPLLLPLLFTGVVVVFEGPGYIFVGVVPWAGICGGKTDFGDLGFLDWPFFRCRRWRPLYVLSILQLLDKGIFSPGDTGYSEKSSWCAIAFRPLFFNGGSEGSRQVFPRLFLPLAPLPSHGLGCLLEVFWHIINRFRPPPSCPTHSPSFGLSDFHFEGA